MSSSHLRGSGIRRFIAIATIATVGSATLPTLARPGDAATSTCSPAPQLRAVTINQGLPYQQLAPGKDVLVRLFLQKPKCADNVQVQLAGASVTVSGGTAPHTVTETVPALDPADAVLPVIAPHGTFPVDHPGDPIVIVPGSAIRGSDGAAFELRVDASVSYRSRTSSTEPWGPLLSTPSTGALADGTPMRAGVGPATNPLRVLVVPMGDLSAGRDVQFPADATRAVEDGMRALGRMFPTFEGVGDLTSTSAGLRYRIAPTMLDLGPQGLNVMPVDSDGVRRFCGLEANFPNIGRLLAAHLVAWNTANPLHGADRVIGAVWESVSKGSPCAEGVGSLTTREGWVRAIRDRAATGTTAAVASKTGSLLAMEIQHTFGGVAVDAPNHGTGRHSKFTEADGGTQRAHHLTEARYIATDRTVMRYTSAGWDNSNTVLEEPDWQLARCVLEHRCTTGGLIGSPAAGRSGPSIVVSGVTDGTAVGTDAHSYTAEEVERTPADAASPYSLRQLDAGGTELQVDRFAVGAQHDHHAGDANESPDAHVAEFDVAVAEHPEAVRFQLRKHEVVLFERASGDVPQFVATTSVAGAQERITAPPAHPGDDLAPTLAGDGTVLAWQDPDGIRLRRRAGGPVAGLGVPRAMHPTLDAAGTRLAYVLDGDLWVADVSAAGDAGPSTSGHRRVYDDADQLLGDAALDAPAFRTSPAGSSQVVAVIGGDLWTIDTDFRPSLSNPLVCRVGALPSAPCRPLTVTGGVGGAVATTAASETNPSWSGDVVAYERDRSVWTLQPSSPETTQQRRATGGSDPAVGTDLVVFSRGGDLVAADVSTFEPQVTLVADGARAAVGGGSSVVAFDRTVNGQRDVFLVDVGDGGNQIVVRHPRPAELRADVWARGPGGADPMLVALRPTAVAGDLATFSIDFDDSGIPPGRTRRVQVSDGWETATRDEPHTGGAVRPPVAEIAAPSVDAETLQYDVIPLTGSARDAQGDELQGDSLRWFHLRPGASAPVLVGTGPRVAGPGIDTTGFLSPPAGGWQRGRHVVTLVATDAAGATDTATVELDVLADADRDGRAAIRELVCPGRTGGDDDPYDGFRDDDRDGILNGDDAERCAPDTNVVADFDPDSLQVTSSGNPVTVYFSGAGGLAGISPNTVHVVQLGYQQLDAPLRATSWSYDPLRGVATAKFDRGRLTAQMHERGLVGGWTPVVITGAGGGFSFRGIDPHAPDTFPSN